MKQLLLAIPAFVLLVTIGIQPVAAQNFLRVSYGDDLFAIGGGARAMGMGGAQVALVDDVTAGFWNPAGLSGVTTRQISYMHSERFGGLVSYDYGAFAMPLRREGDVLAITFFRQGVDGIKNTLNAWDRERDRPVANPQDYITEFTTADMAFLVSYGTRYSDELRWGVSAKVLYSRLGPFANGLGYSVDAGAQYRKGRLMAGVNLQNITTLMKLWSVNENELEPLRDFFGDDSLNEMPVGQNEYTPPSVRAGIASFYDIQDFRITGVLDLNLHFEGRRTYHVNLGGMSLQPHAGIEAGYKESVFLRIGVTDVYTDKDSALLASPTLGAGFRAGMLFFDYSFGSFAGANALLGSTHRLSARISF
jgi:hypothetical protein